MTLRYIRAVTSFEVNNPIRAIPEPPEAPDGFSDDEWALVAVVHRERARDVLVICYWQLAVRHSKRGG